MKLLYASALGAALLLGGLRTQAQTGPVTTGYRLGTSQALVQELEAQAAPRTARNASSGPPTVQLRVAPGQSFTGQVNYRQDLGATGEYLVGELPGEVGSSFQLRIEGQQVEGTIIRKAARKAYRYSADAQGNAVVQEVDINQVICIDYNKPVGYHEPASAARTTAPVAQAATISLQSLPGARGCVLLDVDGYALPAGTGWNNGNAYNAASANMTDANVQALWELVSEDYRPFSMNVTTDENVFNTYPKNMRMRCVISPASGSTIAPGAGGVAFLTSFKTNDDTPCWVFMSDPKSGGEAASHELGHTLGLSHDGRISPQEGYYTGQDNSGAWAPIMGAGYYKPVTTWSRGEYNSANNQEDDLAIMSSATYNVGYRADDYGNTTGTAAALARSGTSLSARGIIERTTDQDYFSFTTSGGNVSFNVNTVSRYGDLDIVVRLFEGSGAQIGTFDTPGGGNLNVAFTASLGAGTYYLQVDGTSSGNPATDGYSDYASLGTYTIAGTAPAGGTTPPPASIATFYRDCSYGGTAVALPVGDYSLSQLQAKGILNDDISSLQVASGYQVVLYENDGFGGASLTLTASNSCLVGNALGAGNWNDQVSSLRVQAASSVAFSRQLEAEAASVNNGMLVETCTDAGGGQNMGYIDQGDYLVWNGIALPSTGAYLVEYRVASAGNGGTLSADLNAGTTQLGNTTIPGTGGWQTWTTVSKSVNLTAGTYNFGVYAQTAGYNINWVRITYQGAASLVATATPAASAPAAAAVAASAPAAPTLELYPNPATDHLQLQTTQDLAGSSFRIVDALGRPVHGGSAAAGNVDVSSLRAGMYTLVLTTPGQAPVTRRFVK